MRRLRSLGWCITLLGVIMFAGLKAPSVGAFFEPQIAKLLEKFRPAKGTVAVSADITLTPDGDSNKNNFIDTGDSVAISYILANTTSNDLSSLTLKTKIERSKIGQLRSIKGTASLDESDGNISIPNLSTKANTSQVISFEATVVDSETTLNIDAELLDESTQAVASSGQKSVEIKEIDRELPTLIKRTKQQ